jgi:hypothetical protein
MSDRYTEVTTQGFFSRIIGSFVGALIGILMIIGGIILLWWNEGRAVDAIRTLDAAARQVVEIDSASVNKATDGKLVHLTGKMATTSPARDRSFGIGGNDVLRLKRTVEMYQWTETKSTRTHDNVGGSQTTETTYTYNREWAEGARNSTNFHEPSGHHNPQLPIESTTIDSPEVTLGAYQVAHGLLDTVSDFKPLAPPEDARLPSGFRAEGNMLYRGADIASPTIGDIRVHYGAVLAQTMSAVSALTDGTLVPYHAPSGYEIALTAPGSASATAMFNEKKSEEGTLTWIMRGVGFALLLFGFTLGASPISVVASIIPFLGELMGAGAFLAALIISTPLTILVIALAWIAHRPVTGIILLVVAGGVGYLLSRLHRRKAAIA